MARKKTSQKKIVLGLLGVIVVLLLFAFIGKSKGWIGKPDALEVEIADVFRTDIIEKVSASGTIQPETEVKISPDVPGEIIELHVAEGDSVIEGELMIKIRPDNFVTSLERAKAALNQQRANLANAKARLASAEAQFIRTELEYNRNQQLKDENVISEADFELAEANYKIAKSDLESARKNVEAAEYVVTSSLASVQEAEENLRLTSVRAPVNGIVSKLSVEQGERVVGTQQMAGTEMLRIADLSRMEVRVDVNENDIIRVSLGDTAVIDVDSYSHLDKLFKGIVTEIANTANQKSSPDAVTEFEVRIRILNSSYQDLIEQRKAKYPFRPGMTASVDIITEVKNDVLAVPLAAVTTRVLNDEGDNEDNDQEVELEFNSDENQEEIVFKIVGEKVEKVKVKTGISDFNNIEIESGLTLDDKIVSGPFGIVSKRLKDGDFVEPKEKNKPEDKP